MPLLNRVDAMLNRRLKQAAGIAITYTRGAETITIAATAGAWASGASRFSSILDNGQRIEWSDRDYLIPAALLTALPASPGSVAGEPIAGDRITETINGVESVFEVMLPDTGEPAARFSDSGRTRYRVHTKQVK